MWKVLDKLAEFVFMWMCMTLAVLTACGLILTGAAFVVWDLEVLQLVSVQTAFRFSVLVALIYEIRALAKGYYK